MSFLNKFLFLCCFVFLSFVSNALSDTQLYFYTEHRPPFHFIENKEISGFSTEILKAALEQTPYIYDLNIYSWSNSYNIAQKKQNACIYVIARTPEREKLFQWTVPLISTELMFVGLKSNKNIQLNSIEDAKNYRIAVLKDDVSHQLLIKHGFDENKNMYVYKNSTSVFKLLSTRSNIDLILTDQISIQNNEKYYQLDPNQYKSFFKLTKNPLEFSIACSKQTNPEIVNNLSLSIKRIKDNGTYQKIFDKWFTAKK